MEDLTCVLGSQEIPQIKPYWLSKHKTENSFYDNTSCIYYTASNSPKHNEWIIFVKLKIKIIAQKLGFQ